MTSVETIMHRAHVRGSVEAWNLLEKARLALLATGKNAYVDYEAILVLVDGIQAEQDRLITLRPQTLKGTT